MTEENLPRQPTPLIGRTEELAHLAARLDDLDCRLLMITGPGGVGKTRLALAAADQKGNDFADGACFIDLQPVETSGFLSAIADALPLSLSGREPPRAQLRNYLSDKEMLLLLDNFEHLLEEATFLGELASEAPSVKLLVTSREALNLQQEWLYSLLWERAALTNFNPKPYLSLEVKGMAICYTNNHKVRRCCKERKMNAIDVMRNGHGTVLEAVDGLAASHWQTPGVCGVWTVKDIIAHLASYEWMLVEVLNSLVYEDAATPTLNRFDEGLAAFNDAEVAKRRDDSADEVLAEYKNAYEEVMALAERVPVGAWTQNGVLPWYGDAYDLDDCIAYSFYGHKREHCAQIAAFRDRLAGNR